MMNRQLPDPNTDIGGPGWDISDVLTVLGVIACVLLGALGAGLMAGLVVVGYRLVT